MHHQHLVTFFLSNTAAHHNCDHVASGSTTQLQSSWLFNPGAHLQIQLIVLYSICIQKSFLKLRVIYSRPRVNFPVLNHCPYNYISYSITPFPRITVALVYKAVLFPTVVHSLCIFFLSAFPDAFQILCTGAECQQSQLVFVLPSKFFRCVSMYLIFTRTFHCFDPLPV